MYYKHEGVDHKVYERTGKSLLCLRHLEKELPQTCVLLKMDEMILYECKKNAPIMKLI